MDCIEPPSRFKPLSVNDRDSITKEVALATKTGCAWLEKIRRFASYHGHNLRQQADVRFGLEVEEHLEWMAAILMQSKSLCSSSGSAPCDQALLNGALYCFDALRKPAPQALETAMIELENWLLHTNASTLEPVAMGPNFDESFAYLKNETEVGGIVIVSPNPFSLFSNSVFAILQRLGVPVCAVIVRKFTLSRFRQEVRRDGTRRLIRKIYRKLILRSDENPDKTAISLKSVSVRLGLSGSDLRKMAKKAGTTVIEVAEFDDALPSLGPLNPQLAIFTGGGMIRQSFLDSMPHGILNIHMGSLPHHKGMDVVQAPILEGYFDDISLTAHLMEARLDRGPVLQRYQISSDCYLSLGALRNELSAISPILAIDTALGRLSGRLAPEIQPEVGRQYYFVHKRMLDIIDRVLPSRHDPKSPEPIMITVDRFFETLARLKV